MMGNKQVGKTYWYILGGLIVLQYALSIVVLFIRIRLGAQATNIEGLAYMLLLLESFLLGILLKQNQTTTYATWLRAINVAISIMIVLLFMIAIFYRILE
jgi:hypothetical protein